MPRLIHDIIDESYNIGLNGEKLPNIQDIERIIRSHSLYKEGVLNIYHYAKICMVVYETTILGRIESNRL